MHVYRHRVRYHEVDGQGFVFNARYLEIADVAMTEYLRELGFDYSDLLEGAFDPSVVNAVIGFARPARFDDLVDVDAACTRVGRASFDVRYSLTRGDEELARVELVYVNVDTESERSRPLPEGIGAVLRAQAANGAGSAVAD